MLSSIPETEVTSDHEDMTMDLYLANEPMAAKFASAVEMANSEKQYGLSNFLADRQTAHQKLSWQLRASVSEMLAEEAMPEAEAEPETPSINE
jgi:DNA-binding ferritin-like protein